MALRTVTGLIAVPLAVIVIQEGGPALAVVVSLVLVAAVFELSAGMGLSLRDPVPWLTGAGVIAMVAVALTDDIPVAWPLTATALAVVAAPTLSELWAGRHNDAETPPFAEMFSRASTGLFGVIYIGWLGSYFILLRESNLWAEAGVEWLLLAVFAVMATDTGAFFVGRIFGRHQLAPRISPAKTIEGAIGGLAGGFAAVLLINLMPDLDVAIWKMVLLGLALPVIAQIGDLTESVIKRALRVKDFSQLLPGHGGVLDRLDSLLFGVPAVYFFVQWVVI